MYLISKLYCKKLNFRYLYVKMNIPIKKMKCSAYQFFSLVCGVFSCASSLLQMSCMNDQRLAVPLVQVQQQSGV